jgi:glucose-1-phosphate cytidylyltransferase
MKVVILAGGLGTRLAEETGVRPKPMVLIGGRPILWHIMKIYSHYGFNDFIVCLGYKGEVIREYFASYFLNSSDVTVDLARNEIEVHRSEAEPWRVTLVNTGERSMTGGRLRRVMPYLDSAPYFALTYGDGLSDIDIKAEVDFHKLHGKLATVAAVRPSRRFGVMTTDGPDVTAFNEKPHGEGGWINGGFFILSPKVADFLHDDADVWEGLPLENLAKLGELRAFHHDGFWHAMDALSDKKFLDDRWHSGAPEWKVWNAQ